VVIGNSRGIPHASIKEKTKRGYFDEQIRDALSAFLAPLEIISFDWNAAFHYGQIRAFFEENGMIIGEWICL